MRVDELRAGVYALQAFASFEYGKFKDTNARDVSQIIYKEYKDKLPLSGLSAANTGIPSLNV